MKKPVAVFAALATLVLSTVGDRLSGHASAAGPPNDKARVSQADLAIATNAAGMIQRGRRAFRFDTFGDEEFWGDTLRLHEAIAGANFGGVGPGLSPRAALAAGLKMDTQALPKQLIDKLRTGQVDLDDPATTLLLLRLNSVVGLTGFFDGARLRSIGIQCALCHSVVDDSLAPGLGRRLDGWANRDLNVGAIVSLAPNLQPVADLLGTDVATVLAVLGAWGPGKFDAALFLDGKGFRPDGKTAATLIPPAFALPGVNLHTWTGWGSVTHWNAFVAVLEMHGKGTFFDPRLDDPVRFPVAARNGFGHVTTDDDRVTPQLEALHFYQLALPAPDAPAGTFDRAAANRGKAVFEGTGRCVSCHVPPLFTEPGWNMHPPEEMGIDSFQAERSPDGAYRTSPLKGLWTHTKGGFFHDGRFPTLLDVIQHYNQTFGLGLTGPQQSDLAEYLKSL